MKIYFRFLRSLFLTNSKTYFAYAFLLLVTLCMELLFPVLTGRFINMLVEKEDFNVVLTLLLLIAILGFTNQLVSVAKSILYNRYSEFKKNEVRLKIIDIVRGSKYEDLSMINAASFTQRINLDLGQIISFITDNLLNVILRSIQFVLLLIYITVLDFNLGILTILFLPIYAFAYYIYRKKLYFWADETKNAASSYYEMFNSQIDAIDDVVHSGEYESENDRFNKGFLDYFKIFKEYIAVNIKFDFSQGLVALLLNLVMFAICANKIINGEMKVGTLTVLMSYFTMLLSSIAYGFETAKKYQLTMASLNKIIAIFNLKQCTEGKRRFADKIKKIEANVSFGYDEKLLYNHLLLDFNSNNIYGVLGLNGKGKSTLYKLLTGIIKAESSSIKINDVYINELDTVHLRREHVFFVKQKCESKKISVGEYLLNRMNFSSFNDLKDTLTNKKVSSKSIILFLKKKWNDSMDELSGGDLKTIYILESFLIDKELKIYDEPTANLDVDRRTWFIDSLSKIKNGSIVIIITHDEELKAVFDQTILVNDISD